MNIPDTKAVPEVRRILPNFKAASQKLFRVKAIPKINQSINLDCLLGLQSGP